MVSLLEAFRGLRRYPLRTSLTLLGLAVGVASVSASVALLRASHDLALQSILRYGALDLVRVSSPDGYWRDWHWTRIAKRAALGREDAARFRAALPGLRDVMLTVNVDATLRHAAVTADARIQGVGANAPAFLPIVIRAGRFLDAREESLGERSAVLSRALAERLFERAERAVGEEVLVGAQRFDVVGMFDPPRDESGEEVLVCYVPFRAAVERLGAAREETQIWLGAGSRGLLDVEESAAALAPLLRPNLTLASYFIDSPRADVAEIEAQARMQSTILGGIAALSMLVASSGVLNTLLVGVKERTREIGTRRALGARRGAIRRQFLLEALALGIPGALVGMGAGALLAKELGSILASGLTDPASLHVAVETRELLLAGVGGVFLAALAGIAPAWQAAGVEPAEALRYE